MDKNEVLKQYFGHSEFRPGQGDIIDHILAGQDCLGVMPTGAGKSVCFQVPALMFSGTSIVISPLISLMKDQVEGLRQSGVNAAFINSSLDLWEYRQVLDNASSGLYKILYVAPERLTADGFLGMCRGLDIPLVAVDEAHCVSHWGQDFRPSYLKISEFVEQLPKRPVLAAFTATATDIVKDDIVRILGLRQPFSVTTGFDRPNLYFEVRPTEQRNKNAVLLGIIREMQGRSSIVYCSTRKNVEAVTDFLRLNGVNVRSYHAGMPDDERRSAQEDFTYDRCNVIVATNAFGMGIDKSDVALVVHYNMPKDLESYYQEAGRAGRDGSPARCILLYSKGDVRTAEFIIDHGREESGLTPGGAGENAAARSRAPEADDVLLHDPAVSAAFHTELFWGGFPGGVRKVQQLQRRNGHSGHHGGGAEGDILRVPAQTAGAFRRESAGKRDTLRQRERTDKGRRLRYPLHLRHNEGRQTDLCPGDNRPSGASGGCFQSAMITTRWR